MTDIKDVITSVTTAALLAQTLLDQKDQHPHPYHQEHRPVSTVMTATVYGKIDLRNWGPYNPYTNLQGVVQFPTLGLDI